MASAARRRNIWRRLPGSVLVETSDGGTTWHEQTTWKQAAPASSVYTVRSLSPTTGVLTVGPEIDSRDESRSGPFAALVTFDGGRTWHRQALPGEATYCERVAAEVWCSSGMDLLKIRIQP